MEIIYYPHLYVYSDYSLKSLLLFWDKIKTIIPPSHENYINSCLNGTVKHQHDMDLERYMRILDLAGEKVLDFVVINGAEKMAASEKMFDLIHTWNKDTNFYNSLRMDSSKSQIYGLLNDKGDEALISILLDEKLVQRKSPGEIVGSWQVVKSYMSIIAEEIKNRRSARLITDDEFYVASKSGINQVKSNTPCNIDEGYQLVSMAVPQLYLDPEKLDKLSFEQILKIRKDIIPLATGYYTELENYQKRINSFIEENKDQEAFDLYCEFCERVSISFLSFSKEISGILRITQNPFIIGFINGIVLPSIKVLNPDKSNIAQFCDYAAIAVTAGSYSPINRKRTGFEYLECLNRNINIELLKGTITCLVPKSIRSKLNGQILLPSQIGC